MTFTIIGITLLLIIFKFDYLLEKEISSKTLYYTLLLIYYIISFSLIFHELTVSYPFILIFIKSTYEIWDNQNDTKN